MPFKKGESGNPNGRPKKGQTITDLIRENLDKVDIELDNGTFVTGKEALVDRLKELAIRGDMTAIKYIIDRMDGPVKQELSFSGDVTIVDDICGSDD